ncbi:mitochondrial import inner membrane translocase subunit TIM23-2-like isoform X2 [Cicer arietinum]|uniref:mitochondrial import inner membrane translocase subunit TIM23-2-like isoform X2 n=1 Tax=Cicer arietinum TaxID=3827 RepID=UPI00032A5378
MAHNGSNSDPNPQARFYNPYKDLDIPIQNLYKLSTSPEFLFDEEARRKRSSWGENLTFYTGCGYLGGSIAGVGFVDDVKAFESNDTAKLQMTTSC